MALVVMILLFGGYLFYLDGQVRSHFEGKRWALPAKVFARPLELFVGRPLKPDQLEAELAAAGYLKRNQLPQGGVYWRDGNRFSINSRPFQFPEGHEQGQRIDAELSDARVEQLWLDGEQVPLIAPPSLRVGIRRLIEPVVPRLPVISLSELPTQTPVQSLAVWELGDDN